MRRHPAYFALIEFLMMKTDKRSISLCEHLKRVIHRTALNLSSKSCHSVMLRGAVSAEDAVSPVPVSSSL